MADLWIPGVPIAEGNWHGYHNCRPEVTCHRTYGGWGGDYSVIQSEGLAHLLIGKQEGQWVQFAPANVVQWHDAVNVGYGIEMTGVNEDDFTDWQVRCVAYVMPHLEAMIGVPRVYSDGSEGWVDVNYWAGWHSHNMIIPSGGGSQHTNIWKRSDWDRVLQLVQGSTAPAQKKAMEEMIYHNKDVHDPDGNTATGEWSMRIGYGLTKITGGEAFVHALAGVPWMDNCSTLQLLGLNVRGAQAQRNQEFWLTKVPSA